VGVLPDGRVFAADARPRLRVYDHDGATILADLPLEARARALRVSPDGRRLAILPRPAAKPADPELWDLEHYRRVAQLAGHVGGVFAARFHTDILLTAGADSSVRMWDSRTGSLMQTYQGGSRTMTDATLDPTGQFLVAGGGDGSLRFWDRSGSLIWQQVAHRSPIAGIHYQGQDLISRGFGGDISRWMFAPAPGPVHEHEHPEQRSSDR
jgi:WD40 repeat protein